jgi:carboxyl-terminal processing protease
LSAKQPNNSNDDDIVDPVKDPIDKALSKVSVFLQASIIDKIPAPIVDAVRTVLDFWNKIKWALASFITGVVVAGAVLIVPLYNDLSNVNQPVTLFETILNDLEMSYVDEVDTNKLFETGINAMLQSLDPYTEFEGRQEAALLTESIDGRYGGVGLVIAGNPKMQSKAVGNPVLLPKEAKEDAKLLNDKSGGKAGDDLRSSVGQNEDDEDYDEVEAYLAKTRKDGIRVVSAFEGYAFDYGMRVGDRLLQVDSTEITSDTTVDQVRDALRGNPGTWVNIQFERDGVSGPQSITMPRTVVKIRDVKLATLLGNPQDGIGYIQLSGFASDAGREVRNAIHYLQQASEDATNGERSLQGLVLDLRGNPGGLLTSSVDVASLLVPKGSDIVSAKGRGFPGILYRSRVDPILSPSTKLAVLVNGNTASAAEIVSGAVQDLDVGVIVGADRTFGKGLVQNVEELPFETALKYTVAKYYTPSGRCIQGVTYKEGEGENGRYLASKVADADRGVYYTTNGRVVKDGGGIEADYKVPSQKASALEVTLLRSGVFSDFASEWSKSHELSHNFEVDEDTYKAFKSFVKKKQQSGELQLEALYLKPISDLKKSLKKSGYVGAEKEVETLRANLIREVEKDFDKYRNDIKEDISQNILARYLPESMLIERGVRNDPQVQATVKLLKSQSSKFEKILARGEVPLNDEQSGSSFTVASMPQ